MIAVASHLVGVMAAAWFGTIGVCAAIDLRKHGGLMGCPNREDN